MFEKRVRRGGPAPPRVLFVNDLWGYGTVTMALAIAEELEGRAVRLFAGMGPGFELARRGPFERLLPADTMADPLPDALGRVLDTCQAVVTVMNERVARAAAQRGIPCVFVDSLLWMWPGPPNIPPGVPYFQESFPGAERRLKEWRDHLPGGEIVGPLVAGTGNGAPRCAEVALVSFGGLSSALIEPATLVTYANAMAQCVLVALDAWPGRVVVTVGRHVLDRMDQAALRAIRPAVELADLGHDAYLAELRRSRVLVSSAGMHALYEAFALGVPCVCLPAQNLSQVLALRALERARLDRPLDWRGLYGLRELDSADEAAAVRRIGEQILRFSRDAAARRALVRHLRGRLGDRRLRGLQRRQARFYRQQGERGAPRVAARVMELLQTHEAKGLQQGA